MPIKALCLTDKKNHMIKSKPVIKIDKTSNGMVRARITGYSPRCNKGKTKMSRYITNKGLSAGKCGPKQRRNPISGRCNLTRNLAQNILHSGPRPKTRSVSRPKTRSVKTVSRPKTRSVSRPKTVPMYRTTSRTKSRPMSDYIKKYNQILTKNR